MSGFRPSASSLATWLSRTTNAPFDRTFAKRQGTVGSFDDSADKYNDHPVGGGGEGVHRSPHAQGDRDHGGPGQRDGYCKREALGVVLGNGNAGAARRGPNLFRKRMCEEYYSWWTGGRFD